MLLLGNRSIVAVHCCSASPFSGLKKNIKKYGEFMGIILLLLDEKLRMFTNEEKLSHVPIPRRDKKKKELVSKGNLIKFISNSNEQEENGSLFIVETLQYSTREVDVVVLLWLRGIRYGRKYNETAEVTFPRNGKYMRKKRRQVV